MSGGHFDYKQHAINDIIDGIEFQISNNRKKKENDFGYDYTYSDGVIQEFKKGIEILKKAQIYAQRIDWLISGDDSEEDFHERLKEDLEKIK